MTWLFLIKGQLRWLVHGGTFFFLLLLLYTWVDRKRNFMAACTEQTLECALFHARPAALTDCASCVPLRVHSNGDCLPTGKHILQQHQQHNTYAPLTMNKSYSYS